MPSSGQRRPASSAMRAISVLGHAGIMLQLQRCERPRLVAAQADETDRRADIGAPARKRSAFGGGVEIGRALAPRMS